MRTDLNQVDSILSQYNYQKIQKFLKHEPNSSGLNNCTLLPKAGRNATASWSIPKGKHLQLFRPLSGFPRGLLKMHEKKHTTHLGKFPPSSQEKMHTPLVSYCQTLPPESPMLLSLYLLNWSTEIWVSLFTIALYFLLHGEQLSFLA